jgi:hypothetical protein
LLQTSFSSEASHYCELGQGGCGTKEMAIHSGEAYIPSQQATEDQMADTTSGDEVRLTSPAGVQIVVLSAFVLLLYSDL